MIPPYSDPRVDRKRKKIVYIILVLLLLPILVGIYYSSLMEMASGPPPIVVYRDVIIHSEELPNSTYVFYLDIRDCYWWHEFDGGSHRSENYRLPPYWDIDILHNSTEIASEVFSDEFFYEGPIIENRSNNETHYILTSKYGYMTFYLHNKTYVSPGDRLKIYKPDVKPGDKLSVSCCPLYIDVDLPTPEEPIHIKGIHKWR